MNLQMNRRCLSKLEVSWSIEKETILYWKTYSEAWDWDCMKKREHFMYQLKKPKLSVKVETVPI